MRYGELCDIEKQCNEVGYTLGKAKELVEKLHFGLNICHIHGILTDGEYDKALKRLNKMVGEKTVPLPKVGETDAE